MQYWVLIVLLIGLIIIIVFFLSTYVTVDAINKYQKKKVIKSLTLEKRKQIIPDNLPTKRKLIIPDNLPPKNLIDGICLSGSGIRGVNVLGILHYFYENGYLSNIKTFCGCSMGSVICLLINLGYSPEEVKNLIISERVFFESYTQSFSIMNVISGKGAISKLPLYKLIKKYMVAKYKKILTLEELFQKTNQTLILVSFCYSKQKTEYIAHNTDPNLDSIKAVFMSSAVPFFFKEERYNGELYMDGFVEDVYPIKYLKTKCKFPLGINIIHQFDTENIKYDPLNIVVNLYKHLITKDVNEYNNIENAYQIHASFNDISLISLKNIGIIDTIFKDGTNIINDYYKKSPKIYEQTT